MHHIGDGVNPYEQAISIIGKTLAAFDEDNLIPCFGFGDGMLLLTCLTMNIQLRNCEVTSATSYVGSIYAWSRCFLLLSGWEIL